MARAVCVHIEAQGIQENAPLVFVGFGNLVDRIALNVRGRGRFFVRVNVVREILKLKQSANPEERKLGELAGSFFKTLCDMSSESTTVGDIWALKSRIVKLARRFGHLKGHAGAFVRRLEKNFESLWFFVTEPLVDKTNNFTERQIRTAVCHRKISFGSSAPKGERWIERSLSLRKTCALHGRSYFTVLVKAIECYQNMTRPQTYWIRKSVWRLNNAWMYGTTAAFYRISKLFEHKNTNQLLDNWRGKEAPSFSYLL